jgi:hypothetical protein
MKKFIFYTSLTTALFVTSCGDFGDINVSPNASTTPLTSALLTNSLTQIGTSVTGGASLISGFYGQYFTQTQYTESSLYTEQDINWSGDIAGPINDLKKIIDINSDPATAALAATKGSNNNQIAIARILKAYRFSILTDRYGDMPYSQALDETNLTPVFDAQEDIYEDIFKELDEASLQFDDGLAVQGDILFGGDNKKWIKFANSLRLILALRVSEANEALGRLQFLDALQNKGSITESTISSNEDNVELVYVGGPNAFKNPFFAIAADQGIANTMVDFISNDRRKFAFGKPNASGVLTGFEYGLVREKALQYAAANPGWSLILNDGFRGETSKLFVLTYADVLMARAEAAERGWSTGVDNGQGVTNSESAVADKLFRGAVEASWKQWGVYIMASDNEDADKDGELDRSAAQLDSAAQVRLTAYIDNETGFVSGAGDAMEIIGTQRWITFYPNGPQGWSEWRRTGYPELTPTPAAVNVSKQIPTRFKYPSVEYGYNPVNIAQAAGRFDAGDNDNSHVWWDQ